MIRILKSTVIQHKMVVPVRLAFPLFVVLVISIACTSNRPKELYHVFPGGIWERYNILSFEIPVEEAGEPVDVILFGNFTEGFQYETLDFNMTMKTPSGEERIKEYQMKVKTKEGIFLGEKRDKNHYCEIALKRRLNTGKAGKMVIQIENLIPRLRTEGIEGIGVRLSPGRK
jgi:gliding motility-associated lipoprotein GldH